MNYNLAINYPAFVILFPLQIFFSLSLGQKYFYFKNLFSKETLIRTLYKILLQWCRLCNVWCLPAFSWLFWRLICWGREGWCREGFLKIKWKKIICFAFDPSHFKGSDRLDMVIELRVQTYLRCRAQIQSLKSRWIVDSGEVILRILRKFIFKIDFAL